MIKLFAVIFLAGCILSCKSNERSYIYYGNWMTPDVYNVSLLKRNPSEVKENLYVELNDTGFQASGKLNSYDLYKFDRKGNIVFYKMFIEGASFSELSTEYTDDGPRSISKIYMDIHSTQPDHETKVVTERTGADQFKENHFKNGVYDYHTMTTFLNNGLMVREEKMNHDTLIWTVTRFFENGIVAREEAASAKEKSKGQYYYSAGRLMDSIVTVKNDRKIKRLFTRNAQGDVILYEETENGKTTEIKRMKYEYDTKGNWIKQITREENKVPGGLFAGQRFPEYSIVVREIKY
ncbi:MAG: hypothetical protein WDO16_24985 [Bacteroidota bacterium]